jgi:hypothetical protein
MPPISGVSLSGCVLSSIHYEGLSNNGDVIGLLFGDQNVPAKSGLELSDELSQSQSSEDHQGAHVDIKGFVVCPELSPWGRGSPSGDTYLAQIRQVVQAHKVSKHGERHPIVGTFSCRQNASLGPSLADTYIQHTLSSVIGGDESESNLVFASFAFEIDPSSNTQSVDYKFLEFDPRTR